MRSTQTHIEQLRSLWLQETMPSARRLLVAAVSVGVVGAAWLARTGTPLGRIAAAVVLLLVPVGLIARQWVVRQRRRDAQAVLQATVAQTDPALGAAVLRGVRLAEQTEGQVDRGSPQLARLHVARLFQRVSWRNVARRLGRRAWWSSAVALGLACSALLLVLAGPFSIVEGFAVLAALDGVAPARFDYLDDQRVIVDPPAYLHAPRRSLSVRRPAAVPVGSRLTVHGRPTHEGRHLVLTDGTTEVAFHDDGGGGSVARWTVARDTQLWVAARFGDVRVREARSLSLHALADQAPQVRLIGAPATLKLLEQPRIPIHYEVLDDHGLREVTLVLRAGPREQRRPLSRPVGRADRGGVELRANDEFLNKSYLPVEICIEAQDSDPISGPKTGRSEVIIALPPQIGQREARRLAALRRARDVLVDLLAGRLERAAPTSAERARYVTRERRLQEAAFESVQAELHRDDSGLPLPGRSAAVVNGQMERLDEAVDKLASGDLGQRQRELVATTELTVLAVDAVYGALGQRDTKQAARKLAEVAAEVATAITLHRDPTQRPRARRRMDAALLVLEGGAMQLLLLGQLGLDLGQIAQNGLRRIRRAWSQGDAHHAKLAAEDLAARLRNPDPSFGSAGGSGIGGVETGGAEPTPQEASSAARQMAELQQALEELRLEHAAEMAAVERAMQRALTEADISALREELRQRAADVRRTVEGLPRMSGSQARSDQAGAMGRAHGEAMAAAMDRADVPDALQRGKDAVLALRSVEQAAANGQGGRGLGREAAEARGALEAQLRWAERAMRELERQASEHAAEQLEQTSKREQQLAERARQLRRDNAMSDGPLPRALQRRLERAGNAMDGASQLLRRRDGARGLERQREAQRLLEMALPETEEPEAGAGADGGGRRTAQDIPVPEENRDARADAFRQRVTHGLRGKISPHLRDALRRYAEGLLR